MTVHATIHPKTLVDQLWYLSKDDHLDCFLQGSASIVKA
jgi:hypothetical protein